MPGWMQSPMKHLRDLVQHTLVQRTLTVLESSDKHPDTPSMGAGRQALQPARQAGRQTTCTKKLTTPRFYFQSKRPRTVIFRRRLGIESRALFHCPCFPSNLYFWRKIYTSKIATKKGLRIPHPPCTITTIKKGIIDIFIH